MVVVVQNAIQCLQLQSCLHYTLRGINYTFEGWITLYTSRVVDYTFRYIQSTHFIFIEFSILVSELVTKQRMVTNFKHQMQFFSFFYETANSNMNDSPRLPFAMYFGGFFKFIDKINLLDGILTCLDAITHL